MKHAIRKNHTLLLPDTKNKAPIIKARSNSDSENQDDEENDSDTRKNNSLGSVYRKVLKEKSDKYEKIEHKVNMEEANYKILLETGGLRAELIQNIDNFFQNGNK